MKQRTSILLIPVICAVTLVAARLHATEIQHREYSRTKEKELRVVVEVSFGTLTLERGMSDKIAVIDYKESSDTKNKLQLSYEVSGTKGTLRIKLKESVSFWDGDSDNRHNDRHLSLQLTDAIPLSFDVELGAGKGNINVTGLQVKDMRISTGASSVTLECSEENPITAENVEIESGVSKFTAHQLSNINFQSLKFSGGVGSYKLDFGGMLHQDAEASIEVGLGSITIDLPKNLPAKLVYDDNWLSSFSVDDDFEKKHSGTYVTEDFEDAKERLTLNIEAGLGSVKVRRK